MPGGHQNNKNKTTAKDETIYSECANERNFLKAVSVRTSAMVWLYNASHTPKYSASAALKKAPEDEHQIETLTEKNKIRHVVVVVVVVDDDDDDDDGCRCMWR